MKVKLTARTQAVSEDIKTSEDLTVFIARVSNPENQKNFETGAGLLRYCIRNKHWSVFEQVDFTFEIETTRAISAQILRHRSFTFQEFSLRYSALTDGVPAPEIRLASKNGNRQSSSDYASEDLQRVAAFSVKDSYDEYLHLLSMGAAPETARNVLPLCTPTKMYMKGNLRSWITYLIVRKDEHTQKEHREIATQVYNILKEEVPSVFEALSGIYEVFGYVKPSWWVRFNNWIENNIIK